MNSLPAASTSDPLHHEELFRLVNTQASTLADDQHHLLSSDFYALRALVRMQLMSAIANNLFDSFVSDPTNYESLNNKKKDTVNKFTIIGRQQPSHSGEKKKNTHKNKKVVSFQSEDISKSYYFLNHEKSLEFIRQIVDISSEAPYFAGEGFRFYLYNPIYGRKGVINLKDRCSVMRISQHLEYYQHFVDFIFCLYKMPRNADSLSSKKFSYSSNTHESSNLQRLNDLVGHQMNTILKLEKSRLTAILTNFAEQLGTFSWLVAYYENHNCVGCDNTWLRGGNKTAQQDTLNVCHKTLLATYKALIQMKTEPCSDGVEAKLLQLDDSFIGNYEVFKKNYRQLQQRVYDLQAIYEQYRHLMGAAEVIDSESQKLKKEIDSEKESFADHLKEEKQAKEDDEEWQRKYLQAMQLNQQLVTQVEQIERVNRETGRVGQSETVAYQPGHTLIHDTLSSTSSASAAAAAAVTSTDSSSASSASSSLSSTNSEE